MQLGSAGSEPEASAFPEGGEASWARLCAGLRDARTRQTCAPVAAPQPSPLSGPEVPSSGRTGQAGTLVSGARVAQEMGSPVLGLAALWLQAAFPGEEGSAHWLLCFLAG